MVRGARARNGARTARRLGSGGEDRLTVRALERETPDAARRETLDASRRGGGVLSTHARERSRPTRGRPRGVQHPRDVRIDADEVQHPRRSREVQLLRGLREPDDAAGALGVSDEGLDRLEHERRALVATERGERRAELDGIAEARARAVHLQRLHVAGAHRSRVERGANHRLLRQSARRRQAAGSSVLVHRRGRERHATGRESIRGLRLEHQDAHRLAANVPVRGRVEGLAPSVGGEHPRREKRGGGVVRDDGVRAARRRAIDLAVPQLRRGDVRGNDGGTARRVHGERGAVHAEDETQTTRRAAQGVSRGDVRVHGLGRAGSALVPEGDDVRVLVRLVGDADERAAPDGSTPVAVEIVPSRRQRALLRRARVHQHLQKLAVLRVHQHRLRLRQTERRGVERVHALHEPPGEG